MEHKDRIVEIEWIDSCTGPDGWSFIEDNVPMLPMSIKTVGIIIDENEKSITVAHSITQSRKQISGYITIPKVSIVRWGNIA